MQFINNILSLRIFMVVHHKRQVSKEIGSCRIIQNKEIRYELIDLWEFGVVKHLHQFSGAVRTICLLLKFGHEHFFV